MFIYVICYKTICWNAKFRRIKHAQWDWGYKPICENQSIKKEWSFSPPPSITNAWFQGNIGHDNSDRRILPLCPPDMCLLWKLHAFPSLAHVSSCDRRLQLAAFIVENVMKKIVKSNWALLAVLEWLITKAPRCPPHIPNTASPQFCLETALFLRKQ